MNASFDAAKKLFEGTKRVYAVPMTLGKYNEYRGWTLPENEDAETPGFLIEYLDGGKPNHEAHEGYISWSPADVFNRAYYEISNAEVYDAQVSQLCGGPIAPDPAVEEQWKRQHALDKAVLVHRGCASSYRTVLRAAKEFYHYLNGSEQAETGE